MQQQVFRQNLHEFRWVILLDRFGLSLLFFRRLGSACFSWWTLAVARFSFQFGAANVFIFSSQTFHPTFSFRRIFMLCWICLRFLTIFKILDKFLSRWDREIFHLCLTYVLGLVFSLTSSSFGRRTSTMFCRCCVLEGWGAFHRIPAIRTVFWRSWC